MTAHVEIFFYSERRSKSNYFLDLVAFRKIAIRRFYALLPLRPPARLVVSCGIGVTSSILPTLNPLRAIALIAA